MKFNPLEARCCFIDGPVAIYLHEAPTGDILESYKRLAPLVGVAAAQLGQAWSLATPGKQVAPQPMMTYQVGATDGLEFP